MGTSYELDLIDQEVDAIISDSGEGAHLELCEGIALKVEEKISPGWRKGAAKSKNLTNEQNKDLNAFISTFGKHRPLTRKEIITFIEELRKSKKTPKYRQSGHLIDEKLKYLPSGAQTSLFDLISTEATIDKDSKIEVKAEGIKLTPPENKLIHALNRILHEKSQNTTNPKKGDFYEGNAPSEMTPYGQGVYAKSAILKFKPSELYKAYLGQDDYSGHEIEFINKVLYQIESKKVLIKYDRIKKITKNKKVEILTDRIEAFQSLIQIISFFPDLTEEEKGMLDNGDTTIRKMKEEIVIALNPIFTDQIDTKFIEFPVDTNRKLVIAAGGHKKVTSSMMTLMEWMLRELSNKRFQCEINEEKLPYILGLEKYVKQNRKKLLNDRIAKDIEAVTNMGIILHAEKEPNATGTFKWIFYLNSDYE